MIGLDTSAIVAIALREPEEAVFSQIVATRHALVGAPTLLEARMVLDARVSDALAFLNDLLNRSSVRVVAFDETMFDAASLAFARFGKGRAHPAKLNFGDCLAYAVAKTHALPLLFKGGDFVHTDIVSAYTPMP